MNGSRLFFVKNGDLSLALERRGNGPRTVLFTHGWISSRRMFYDVVDRLDASSFSSYMLDYRGCGLSDRTPRGHDLEGYASDLRCAIASLGEHVEIVAHSMGGKLAQYVALDPPSNLRRLVLLAPGSARAHGTTSAHRRLTEAAFGSRERIERFQRGAMARILAPEVVERLVDDALVAERDAWFGWYNTGRLADFSDRLKAIRIPTLVVAGEHDPLAPPHRLREEVASGIDGAHFLTLRNVGHNIAVEAPREVAEIITRLPPPTG